MRNAGTLLVVGARFIAKVGGAETEVEIKEINKLQSPGRKTLTRYVCKNLRTKKIVTFKSAAKFLRPILTGDKPQAIYGDPNKSVAGPIDPVSGVPSRVFQGPTTPTIAGEMLKAVEAQEAKTRQELAEKVVGPIVAKLVEEGTLPSGSKPMIMADPNFDKLDAEAGPGGQHQSPKTTDCGPLPSLDIEKLTNPANVVIHNDSYKPAARPGGLSERLKQATQTIRNAPHLIIEARAGTGKTTTLVEGLKLLFKMGNPNIVPSPQQKAVWDSLQLSPVPQFSCFAAFNNSIARELQQRIPQVRGCAAKTLHQLGYYALRSNFKNIRFGEPSSGGRMREIVSEIMKIDLPILRKEYGILLGAVCELGDLCKMNLVHPWDAPRNPETVPEEWWATQLAGLVAHYDIELPSGPGAKAQVYGLVAQVLERCKDVARDGYVDFADMIWLPVVLRLRVLENDILFIDEAQDMNRCQHALAKMAVGTRGRLILCGDPMQAIYGFAGADAESMRRMEVELGSTPRGCVKLPLTVTRRCGKAIVAEAQELVPDFEAHESNGPGEVLEAKYPMQKKRQGGKDSWYEIPVEETYIALVQDGDMVLCRANAPLVNQCFKLLKMGRRAFVQGRKVGEQLVTLVKKLEEAGATTIPEFIELLGQWLKRETDNEKAQRMPSENKLQLMQDRHDCLQEFAKEAVSIEGMKTKIQNVFVGVECPRCKATYDESVAECGRCQCKTERPKGVMYSSIHKAKGLEAEQVFYIQGFGRPDDKLKGWERQQEQNLRYVAITRAIKRLYFVY